MSNTDNVYGRKLTKQIELDLELIETHKIKLPKIMKLEYGGAYLKTLLSIEEVGIVFEITYYFTPELNTLRPGKWIDVIHELAEEKRQQLEEEKHSRFLPVDDTHIDYTVY